MQCKFSLLILELIASSTLDFQAANEDTCIFSLSQKLSTFDIRLSNIVVFAFSQSNGCGSR